MCSAALALPGGQNDLPKEPLHERPCCNGEAAPYMCPATADSRPPARATSPRVTFAPPHGKAAPCVRRCHSRLAPYLAGCSHAWLQRYDVLEVLYPTTHSPARADARLSCGAGGAPGCSVTVF